MRVPNCNRLYSENGSLNGKFLLPTKSQTTMV